MNSDLSVYANDEDIAIRASADYTLLWPRDQLIAAGTDAAILGRDPWTLASNIVDFESQRVSAGNLLLIGKPGSGLRPSGEGLVVGSVSGNTLIFRRRGFPTGTGQPVCPPGGIAGLEFKVFTFAPQIERATMEINRRFGISKFPSGYQGIRSLADPSELRDVTVLTVLYRLYMDMCREAANPKDDFAAKASLLKEELDDCLDRLTLHWNSAAETSLDCSATRFSTKLSR